MVDLDLPNPLDPATQDGWGPRINASLLALKDAVDDATSQLSSVRSQISSLTGAQATTVTVQPGDGRAVVNWTPVSEATSYTVRVQPLGASGVTPASVSKSSTELTHEFVGLTNGVGYYASVTVEPSGAQNSAPFTPTASAASVTLTLTPRNEGILASWTASPDATDIYVERDGTDLNGSGPWGTAEPPTAGSRLFDRLENGTFYNISATSRPGGVKVTKAEAPVASVVVPPPAPPAGSGTVWLSGACDSAHANVAGGGFGTWRGEPSTFARGWADDSITSMREMYFLNAYRDANWNGIIDCAIGGPGRNGDSWASAATGALDAVWRGQLQKINAMWWPNLKGVSLSMAHELSGNWYPWSVNAGNVANFKTAWRRFYNIVTEELKSKGRKAWVTLNHNFDIVADISVQTMDPGLAYYDWLGVDIYNMWWGGTREGGLNTQAAWDANFNAMKGTNPRGPNAWFTYATQIGKPLCVPEWGLNPQVYIDSPFFITTMRNFLATKAPVDPYNPGAGRLAGDAYFNAWPQTRLWPSTSVPNSAAAYRNAKWGAV